jgi:hypothetical protein
VATPHSFNTKRYQHAAIAKKREAFNASPAFSSSELPLIQRSVARRCKPRTILPSHASTSTTQSATPAPAPTTEITPQNVAPLPSISVFVPPSPPAPQAQEPTTSEAAQSPPPPPAPSPSPTSSSGGGGGGGGGGSGPFGNFFAGLNTGGDGMRYVMVFY